MGRTLSQVFSQQGFSSILAAISILFLGILGLAGGIGMWSGKKWGWWLGAFYLTYSVARNLNALIMIPEIVEQFGVPESGLTKYYIKHGGRVIIHSFLVLYFFNSNVEVFSSPNDKKMGKVI